MAGNPSNKCFYLRVDLHFIPAGNELSCHACMDIWRNCVPVARIQHRNHRKRNDLKDAEFLSGISKQDYLMQIQQYMKDHKDEYKNLAEDVFDIISTVTNAGELVELKEKNRNNEGGIDRYKALQEWAQLERMEEKAESVGVIRNMLKQGMSQEVVNHWTGLDKYYIEKIAELNQKSPNESNEKIATMYLKEEQENILPLL